MSAQTTAQTTAVPLRTPAPRKASPLRLVPQRRSSAAKTPFVVVVVLVLVGGLLGLLLLNTLVAQDSFALHDLQARATQLQLQEQELAKQVQAKQAPGNLAAQATSLGMVPGGPPAFLRLPDGTVLGQPSAGVAPPAASTTWTAPRPAPTKQAAAKPATAKPVTGAHR